MYDHHDRMAVILFPVEYAPWIDYELTEPEQLLPMLDQYPGEVIRLTPAQPAKVPHVGWNSLLGVARHPLLAGVKPQVDVYFVHSFHCVPRDENDVIAHCDFGGEFVGAPVFHKQA